MNFEWHPKKAEMNRQKHGVSFEEAQTVFNDPLYLDFYDPDHSDDEQRYLIIRRSQQGRLLIVAYTEHDEKRCLISARETTRKERHAYEYG